MTTDFTSLPYYHANLNRESAEQLLRVLARPGVWLLRPSRSDSVIALSQFIEDFTVSHARIFVHRRPRDQSIFGFAIESDQTIFPTMEQLIARLRFSIANSTPVMRSRSNSPSNQNAATSPRGSDRQLPPVPTPQQQQQQQMQQRQWQMQPAPAPQQLSTHIDVSELQFGDRLGEGSFGAVYQGVLRGHVVAIKVPKQSADVEEQNALESEARLMASIPPHQNVVRCFGLTCKPNLFVALQLCRNGSLYDMLMSNRNIPGTWMLKALRDIVAGMQHLHANAIVHRDLAARNVLLDENYNALIADFGMSRREIGGAHKTVHDSGPLKWLAPESIRARTSSEASDVWSFGIVVTEILTRDEPFPDLEPLQVAIKVAYENLKPTAPRGCTQTIANILQATSQTSPADRPTFAQLQTWLARERNVFAEQQQQPQPQQSQRQR